MAEERMTDYMNVKTDNLQKFLDNCLKRQKQESIEEFKAIRDRIILQMKERYGNTAKGNEYLENLFKEEFKKWE